MQKKEKILSKEIEKHQKIFNISSRVAKIV